MALADSPNSIFSSQNVCNGQKKQHLKSAGKGDYSTIRLCINALVEAIKESKMRELIHFLRVI